MPAYRWAMRLVAIGLVLAFQGALPAWAASPPAQSAPADAGADGSGRTEPTAPAGPTLPAPAPAPSLTAPPKASPTAPALPQSGFGWLLLQMILVLLAVCALAYVLLRWGLRRFQTASRVRPAGMRVVERLGLEPRRALYLVEVGRRYFLVGTSEGSLVLLSEVDPETAAEVERRRPAGGPKVSFRDVLFRKRS